MRRLSLRIGDAAAWLFLAAIAITLWEVTLRYAFNAPTVWAYDMTYMLYGAFFMLGAAYTLFKGSHIRTDTFYGQWSPRVQGIVDSVCYVVIFFPPVVALLYLSIPFFWTAWLRGERVVSSPWMPVIYPLKGVITVACILLILQGTSELLRSLWAARYNQWLPRDGAPANVP